MKQNAADVHRYFSSSFLRFHAGCGFFGSTGARLPRRKPWPSPVPRGGACVSPAARSSARGPPATTATTAHTTLTGAVPELKAEVRAPEPVHGDRQLQQLGPARAVVVVQHEGAVFAGRRLSGAQGDDVLRGNTQASRQGSSDSSERSLGCLRAPRTAQRLERRPQTPAACSRTDCCHRAPAF